MKPDKSDFVHFLLDCGALKFGDFTLKSGRKSPFFINLGEIDSGRKLEMLGNFFALTLHDAFPNTTSLFGPAYKGIALATAASQGYWREFQKDVGVFYNRKEAKEHGEGGLFIGRKPSSDDAIVIIDDVMTDGATKLEALKTIEDTFKVKPQGVVVAVDRSFKNAVAVFHLASIINVLDLITFLREQNDNRADVIHSYWEMGT